MVDRKHEFPLSMLNLSKVVLNYTDLLLDISVCPGT